MCVCLYIFVCSFSTTKNLFFFYIYALETIAHLVKPFILGLHIAYIYLHEDIELKAK